MSIKQAYNSWAEIYDTNQNKTRDLDRIATMKTLSNHQFESLLELGCGTGKNTVWFAERATKLVALDFSLGMLEQARKKVSAKHVSFQQADLKQDWQVDDQAFDMASCNLVLEHIENLDHIFAQAYRKLKPAGKFYICELHPFKQYVGSKARYETENGVEELEVYTHHFSDFIQSAQCNGFRLVTTNEWFDNMLEEPSEHEIPRLISFVFERL